MTRGYSPDMIIIDDLNQRMLEYLDKQLAKINHHQIYGEVPETLIERRLFPLVERFEFKEDVGYTLASPKEPKNQPYYRKFEKRGKY